MNGIQGFYVGGRTEIGTQNQKKGTGGGGYNKTIRERQRFNDFASQREKFERDNQNQNRQTREEFIRDSEQRRNVGKNVDFNKDFQELIGPAGSGSFLFSGNPRTQAFMQKYGLSPEQLVKLRLSVTQPGFRKLGEEVFKDVQARFKPSQSMFNVQNALSQFKTGMSPFDRLPSTRGGLMGGIEDLFAAGPFSMLANKLSGGSPMGSSGLAFGRTQGLGGDRLNQFASVIANDRDLYNQMMMTPEMQKRAFEQNLINVERGLPRSGGNQEVKQEPDPITAAYNPSMNPFLNQGIQPFSYMV